MCTNQPINQMKTHSYIATSKQTNDIKLSTKATTQ